MGDNHDKRDFKTYEEVPESWLDRCTDDGYERFIDAEGNRRCKHSSSDASCPATQDVLTRRERAIQDALASGQNVEKAIRREEAIEQAEKDRKARLFQLGA